MNKLETAMLLLVVGAVLFLAGGATGYVYCKSSQHKEQVKVLHGDAKISLRLEGAHEVRKEQTRQIVKVIQADASTCNRADAGDAFINGMRAKGFPPGSAPSP